MILPKKVLTVFIVFITLAVIIFFVFFRERSNASETEVSQDSTTEIKQKVEDAPVHVKVLPVLKGELVIQLKSSGEAVTNRKIVVKPEVSGYIKRLDVREGKHVKKGELLVELDDERYELDLEKAKAERLKVVSELYLEKQFEPKETSSRLNKKEIEKAKDEFEKAWQLYQKGFISRSEFYDARKKYEFVLIESGEKKEEIMNARKGLTQKDINVSQQEMELEKTKIRAPFSGIICDIKVSPNEHVTASNELFTLVNISRIQVQARVLESEIGKVEVGRNVELLLSAYPGKIFRGEVKAISPLIDPKEKTCKVTIDVANPKEEIKPGMHAEVRIASEIYKNRVLVPQEAVLEREGRQVVFVVDGELAKWRFIEVGFENERYAEVLESNKEGEGVKEGELVVISGHFTLAHDAKVKIVK